MTTFLFTLISLVLQFFHSFLSKNSTLIARECQLLSVCIPVQLSVITLHLFNKASFPGQPGKAGIRKAEPFWILMKQEMMGGSGISWTICKSFALRSWQITTPAPHHSIFYMLGALPATVSKHWRQLTMTNDRQTVGRNLETITSDKQNCYQVAVCSWSCCNAGWYTRATIYESLAPTLQLMTWLA